MNSYTLEEYKLLLEDLYAAIPTPNYVSSLNKPGIINYIESILHEDKDLPWLNFSSKRVLFKSPLERMPLCINSRKRIIKVVAVWRLKIGK